MENVKPQVSSANTDSIAGAGGGMLLVKLAQNLSDENEFKSWLLILAPAFTLFVRYIWNFFSPEISFSIKMFRLHKARRRMIVQFEVLLRDPALSEKSKSILRERIEEAKLAMVDVVSKYYNDTVES